MPLQSSVTDRLARGVPGDKATHNPAVYSVGNPLADGPVTIGRFVWATSDGAANAAPDVTRQPLGFVERVLSHCLPDVYSGASMTVISGAALTVARKGDFYALAATAATPGQKVFAVTADGSLKTGTAGATVAGAIETGWSVVYGGAAGDTIVISNWSA